MPDGWIGVDLDGTLAYYDKWRGPTHIGRPIPLMVVRVKQWLADGEEVRVFTARVSTTLKHERRDIKRAIRVWCLEHIGQILPVTCVKDFKMHELWDDRQSESRRTQDGE